MSNLAIFLDIETTGFSRQWNEIIEIAAILVDLDTNKDLDSFHEYIKPRAKINAQISQLTGITNEMVANCRNEASVLMDFSEWVTLAKPRYLIGHNCKSFDLNFISEKCARFGISWDTNKYNIIDTLVLARALVKDGKITVPNCKQPTLAEYFNITYQAHSAIEDVKALIRIFTAMGQFDDDVGF